MNNNSLLQAYAIAENTRTGFQLPKVRILDYIGGLTNKTREEVRGLAKKYTSNKYANINRNFTVHQSPDLYLGMYNAVTDMGKSTDLSYIKKKVESNGLKEKTIDGFVIKPVKFTTRYGRFQKSYEYTEEYGAKNLKTNAPSPSGVEFILKISKGGVTKGASFTVYKTGRIRFSGGYVTGSNVEPSKLVKFMEMYLPPHGPLSIDINNVTSEVKLGVGIDVKTLYNVITASEGLIKFRSYTLKGTFEPIRNEFLEKTKRNSPFLYVTFDDKFTLVISSNGTIAIEGASNVKKAAEATSDFVKSLKIAGLLKPKSGGSVKIAPNKTKVARRANMKPAPEITRRGTTCPKGRRPKPYSFQGTCPDGYYVAPNPQGQPCCYKIPMRLAPVKKKVANAYTRANVRVPDQVRKLFGIGTNTNNKLNNVGRAAPKNLEMFYNKTIGKGGKPVGFKIGTRQCTRYSKVALLDMAKRMNIKNIPTKTTVPMLCRMLQEASGSPVVVAAPVSDSFKLGKRVCSSYNKTTLIKFGRELGLSLTTSMTREQMCSAIQSKAKPAPKKKTPPPAPKKKKTPPKKKTPSPNMNNLMSFAQGLRTHPKKKTPSPSPANSNDENFDNLLSFAQGLR